MNNIKPNKVMLVTIIIAIIVILIALGLLILIYGNHLAVTKAGTAVPETFENTAPDIGTSDSVKFNELYPDVSKRNVFRFVDEKTTIEFLQNGHGVIFFGFPECPWCQVYAPVLDKAARYSYLKEVLYFNPKDIRANETDSYKKILELLNGYVGKDSDGNPRLYVPTAVFLDDGKIVGYNDDMSTLSGDVKSYFNEQKEKELFDKLYKLAIKVSDGRCCN